MPNHCGNRLTVKGDFKDRDAFVKAVRSEPDGKNEEETLLDFEKIIPTPQNPQPSRQDPMMMLFGGGGGWYGWRCENWGTKWNSYDTILEHDEKKTVYTFLTAWSPPNENFMNAMTNKFPNVEFDLRFAEKGCEFYGYWTKDKHETWKFQNDDVEEILVEDTDEVEDYKLRPGLSLYADIYNISG